MARWTAGATAAVVAIGLSAGVLAPAAGAVSAGDCARTRDPVHDVRYRSVSGPGADLTRLDIYPAAKGCAAAVVIWVHGGGWQVGDKAQGQADKVRLFHDLGYTYVSVNYRLTDSAAADPLRYPVHEQDVAAAIAWVRDHIARYGGDPDTIALLGHSAGAQLVALLGTDEHFLARYDLGLDALACVAPLDTEGFDVAAAASAGGRLSRTYQTAFGTDPSQWRKASALEHVERGKHIPPMFLVERGIPRRKAGVATFAGALRDAGVKVTTVDAGTYTHADVNRRIGVAGEQVITPSLTSFLQSCFG
jgi:arylformamidase